MIDATHEEGAAPALLEALTRAESTLREQLTHSGPDDGGLLTRMGYDALVHPVR